MTFQPRESHDLRLLKSRLEVTPNPANLRWLHDVFDNFVAIATFEGSTSELRFDSTFTLEHCGFTDEEQMRCAFIRALGVPPREYRARFASTGE